MLGKSDQRNLYVSLSLHYLASFYMHVYYLSPQLEYEPGEGRDHVYILSIQAGTTAGEEFTKCLWLVKGGKQYFKGINRIKMGTRRRDAFLSTGCGGRWIDQKGIKEDMRMEAGVPVRKHARGCLKSKVRSM